MKAIRMLVFCVETCLALAMALLQMVITLVQTLGINEPTEEQLMQPAPDPGNLPWLVIRSSAALGKFVEYLPNWVNPPSVQILQMGASAHFKASSFKALADLGVADILARGPKTSQQISDALGASSSGDAIFRLLRLSASSGVFAVDGRMKGSDTRFKNNKLSILLRSDHPNSARSILMHLGNDCDLPWTKLAEGIKAGQTPFKLTYGMDIWQYYKEHPKREEVFSDAMGFQDKMSFNTALKEYNWSQYDHAIDVGGAYGSFLAFLMQSIPGLQGTIFDFPQVVQNAQSLWAREHKEMMEQISFVGGDFFDPKTIPKPKKGQTVYIMRSILHDWNDAASVKILRALAAVMGGTGAKLILVEQVLQDDFLNGNTISHGFDLHMFTMCGGKERSGPEWKSLLGQAGFKLNGIYPSKGIQSMLEVELL